MTCITAKISKVLESREDFKNQLTEDLGREGYAVKFGETEIKEDPVTGVPVEFQKAKVLDGDGGEVGFRLNTKNFQVDGEHYNDLIEDFLEQVEEKLKTEDE